MVPETVDSTEPSTYYVSSYTCIPVIKFNLYIRHGKRFTTINRTTISMYGHKSYMQVVSLSKSIDQNTVLTLLATMRVGTTPS